MISIITPVYNVEKYLEKCIKSILGQSYSDFELLLIDDGSEDSSGLICDNYAKKDQRIKTYHISNLGCAAARNYGLDHSCGDYICFIDSDDYVHPDFLKILISLISEYSADIAMCNYSNVDSQGTIIDNPPKSFTSEVSVYSSSEIAYEVYGNNFVPYVVVWNKLYTRKIWNILRFTQDIHCEDDAIIQKLFHLAEKTVFKDIDLYYYTHNDSGIMHKEGNNLHNLIDDMYGLYLHSFFLNGQDETTNASEAFHCYFTDGIRVLTFLRKSGVAEHHGETITFRGFLRKLKYHYQEAKKEIPINSKRRIYYSLFLAFPSLIISLRSLKHSIKNH